MRTPIPLEMAAFDALSQEERTEFYREAIRRAHAARADAVRELFRAVATRLGEQPVLARAAASSAAVFAAVVAVSVMIGV